MPAVDVFEAAVIARVTARIDRRTGVARLGRSAGPSAGRGGVSPIRFDREFNWYLMLPPVSRPSYGAPRDQGLLLGRAVLVVSESARSDPMANQTP